MLTLTADKIQELDALLADEKQKLATLFQDAFVTIADMVSYPSELGEVQVNFNYSSSDAGLNVSQLVHLQLSHDKWDMGLATKAMLVQHMFNAQIEKLNS